ncbi:hypothetical protein L1887_40426 [Cichorium endivia]|nr:hypothetical protein L1887_40426 [Cichorium endivia]
MLFPLEKEIIIKVGDRKVFITVKDEGWIDEIEEEDAASEDESSEYTTEEEELWSDENSEHNSDNISFNGIPADVEGGGGDWFRNQKMDRHQDRCSSMGGSVIKEDPGWGFEKNNDYDIGKQNEEGWNANRLYKDIQKDTINVDEVAVKETRDISGAGGVEGTQKEPDESDESKAQIPEVEAQGGFVGIPSPTEEIQHSSNPAQDDCMANMEVLKIDKLKSIETGDAVEVEIIYEKSEIEKKRQEKENPEKGFNYSARKWNGGTSMRLFNKMVRDSNRRKGMRGGRGENFGRRIRCPKMNTSSQASKSRNSQEESNGTTDGTSNEFQELRQLGSKIGFLWNTEKKQAAEVPGGAMLGK